MYRRTLCLVEAALFCLVAEVLGRPSAAPRDQPLPTLRIKNRTREAAGIRVSLVVSFCFVFFLSLLRVLAIFITDSAFPAFGVLAQPNLKENCKVSLTQRWGLGSGS